MQLETHVSLYMYTVYIPVSEQQLCMQLTPLYNVYIYSHHPKQQGANQNSVLISTNQKRIFICNQLTIFLPHSEDHIL